MLFPLKWLLRGVWLLLCLPLAAGAQVKLGKNIMKRDSTAALEIESDRQTLLLPRINDTGTLVKTVKDGSLIYYNNNPGSGFNKGLYIRNNNKWDWLMPRSGGWFTIGNNGMNRNINFLGTTDTGRLVFKTNNITRMTIDSAGYVGLGSGLPQASLHNQGSTVLGTLVLSNYSSNTTLSATTTVDLYSVLVIPQTTSGVNITLEAPTIKTPGRVIYIVNTGGAELFGTARTVAGKATALIWSGTAWKQVADFTSIGFPISYKYYNGSSFGLGSLALNNASGNANVALGTNSLTDLTTGQSNVGILGSSVGGTATGNVIMSTGGNLTGDYHVAIGDNALRYTLTGLDNLGVGNFAYGASNDINRSENTAIGNLALNVFNTATTSIGAGSTAVGHLAGGQWGTNNSPLGGVTALGRGAARSRSGIGMTAAGANSLAEASGLNMANSNSTALGFSAFNTDSVTATNNGSTAIINSMAVGAFAQVTGNNPAIVLGSIKPGFESNVGIGTYNPQFKMHVNGQVYCSGSTSMTSDLRLKTDVHPVENALQKIMAVNGVSYQWRTDIARTLKLHTDTLRHPGFIAQELEKILPEVVHTAADSMQLKTVAYTDVIPVITEAIKQQQPLIYALQEKYIYLQSRLKKLQQELNELEKRATAQ